MLVLSRRQNEAICINGRMVTVTVIEIKDDKVRLGIEAPRDMPVHRQEIQRAIEDDEGAKDE